MKPPFKIVIGEDVKRTEERLNTLLQDIYGRIGRDEGKGETTTRKVISITPVTTLVEGYQPIGPGEVTPFVNVVPATVIVGGTSAAQLIPSSYFLDLRAHQNSVTVRHITADWLTLHDNSSPWKTLGLPNIDIVDDISISGPVVNGRDQATIFTSQWVYFFVIYNSSTRVVGGLSSLSSTAPTLPTGYDYFVRVGSSWIDAGHGMWSDAQVGEKIWSHVFVLNAGTPSIAGTYESLSLSSCVPPTAKTVFGYFGLSDTGSKSMAVASSGGTPTIMVYASCHGVLGTSHPVDAVYFELPLLTPQVIYWRGETVTAIFDIVIKGYVDDL